MHFLKPVDAENTYRPRFQVRAPIYIHHARSYRYRVNLAARVDFHRFFNYPSMYYAWKGGAYKKRYCLFPCFSYFYVQEERFFTTFSPHLFSVVVLFETQGFLTSFPLRVNPVKTIPISKSRFELVTPVEIAANPGRIR